jgi:hypothetical protein
VECFGFWRARSVSDWAADVVRAVRAKIQGPYGKGWRASISPASAARRRPLRFRMPAIRLSLAMSTNWRTAAITSADVLLRWPRRRLGSRRDGGPGEDPLFTDFTASDIGTPANPQLPFYMEDRPDAGGYVANRAGSSFVDGGVGAFLTKGHPLSDPLAPAGATTRRDFRCRHCAMWISGPLRTS